MSTLTTSEKRLTPAAPTGAPVAGAHAETSHRTAGMPLQGSFATPCPDSLRLYPARWNDTVVAIPGFQAENQAKPEKAALLT